MSFKIVISFFWAFTLGSVLWADTYTAETCEAGLYKDCYKGVAWGTAINNEVADKLGCSSKLYSIPAKEYKGSDGRYHYTTDVPRKEPVNLLTDQVLTPIHFYPEDTIQEKLSKYRNKKPVLALMEVNFEDTGRGDIFQRQYPDYGSCKAIVFLNILTGFYFSNTSASNDDYLFIKGSMKKKYGKDVIEKKTDNVYFTNWPDVNGLNILLIYSNKEVYVRYIHTSTFNELVKTTDEFMAGQNTGKEKKEMESKKEMLKGL